MSWQDVNTTDGMLVRNINGLNAITAEGYVIHNIQYGLQFYFRKAYPLADVGRGLAPIPSGESRYILFKTTSKKVLFKTRITSFVGEELNLELFAAPTITDFGTQMTIRNYNGVNPQAATVEVYKDVMVSDEGTPLDDEPEYYFGASSACRRDGNSIPEGRERVLPQNAEFLIKVTNSGSGVARFQYFGDWYEGEPAIPNNDLG